VIEIVCGLVQAQRHPHRLGHIESADRDVVRIETTSPKLRVCSRLRSPTSHNEDLHP